MFSNIRVRIVLTLALFFPQVLARHDISLNSQHQFYAGGLQQVEQISPVSRCDPPTQFYTQKVDHFNASSTETFLQQYQLNGQAFKPGGPILYYQGAENAQIVCTERLLITHLAEQLSALVVSLEHRFFGSSLPSNTTDPIERYATLTLDNVMMDSVSFISHIKAIYPGADKSRVVIFGGSYGGSLAAWQRLNYPEVFYGAVANGAPMRAFGYDESNEFMGIQRDHLSSTYQDASYNSSTKIHTSLTWLRNLLLSPNLTIPQISNLSLALNLCTIPNITSPAHENQNLLSSIYNTYLVAAQFTGSVGSPGHTNTFRTVISRTLAAPANDHAAVINASLSTYTAFVGRPAGSCYDWTGQLHPPPWAGIRETFSYIRCRFFPDSGVSWSPRNTSTTNIFPPLPHSFSPSQTQIQSCQRRYNVTPPTGANITSTYHFTPVEIACTKRLLFTAGELDPVSATAPLDLLGRVSADRHASRLIMVADGGHVEDMRMPGPGTKEGVLRAQNVVLQILKGWLADGEN